MVRLAFRRRHCAVLTVTLTLVTLFQFLYSSSETVRTGNEVATRLPKWRLDNATTRTNFTSHTSWPSPSWISDEACLASKSIPLTSQLWMEQLPAIREALLHSPANIPFGSKSVEIGSMVDGVLGTLGPNRLRRSVRPASSNPELHTLQIRRILRVLEERREHPDTAPKLKVLVFGGSVTFGVFCTRKKDEYPPCAWPQHLEFFLNSYLGFDGIELVSLAVRATRTSLATLMLNYGMLPESMREDGPDVIINGYAVNDFLLHSEETKRPHGTTFQEFVDSVNLYTSCERDRPLVMQLDDKVVYKESATLLESEAYNFELAMFTQWSGVWTVSYSDVVRDLANQGGNEEKLFVDFRRDPTHPTWAGHIAIVVTIFFNIMHSALEYCQDLRLLSEGSVEYVKNIENAVDWLDPRHRPPLVSDVTTRTSPEIWKKRNTHRVCSKNGVQRRTCVFSWIARQRVQELLNVSDISSVLETTKGWRYKSEQQERHSGFEALNDKATAVFRVNVDKSITTPNVLNLFYMKSYSEKWQGTLMQGTIYVDSLDSTPVGTFQLSGYHESETSEYFPYTHRFNAIVATAVFIRLEMISGETFKIVALGVCRDDSDQ